MLFPLLLSIILHFNPSNIQTVEGKLISSQTLHYVTNPLPHTQILLQVNDQEIFVDLGSSQYLELQGIILAPGERLRVTGSVIEMNQTTYMVALSVTKKNTTYELRDDQGEPL